jgi:hypothetical protein
MRLILPLALLLGGLGLLAAEMPSSEPTHDSGYRSVVDDSDDWQRTVDGWQRCGDWDLAVKHEAPALHPVVVGSFELLLVMTVALALDLAAFARKPAGTTTSEKSKFSG